MEIRFGKRIEKVHGEGLEVKNEQRKHEYGGKSHPRIDTVCYRSGAHTQRNDRYVICACMCSKGDIAVNKSEQQTKSAVKCLRHSISIYETNREGQDGHIKA